MKRIMFFDIDGTLVPGMSSSQFLAEKLGNGEAVRAAELAYASGLLSNADVSVVDAEGWAGAPVLAIDRWLDQLPLIDGISETVRWCQEREIVPALASLAWRPTSDALARRFGFAVTGGPTIGAADGLYLGTVSSHFDEFDKRDRALAFCAEHKVDPLNCIAIGDSRSDEPLFTEMGFTIALNASAALRERASVALDTTDLRDALPHVDDFCRR